MSKGTSVPSRSAITLDVVNGDLEIGHHSVVNGTGTPPTAKVNGTVRCEGHNTFECSLSAKNFEAENDVTIRGNLEIEDSVEVEDGRMEVYGTVTARTVDVSDALYVSEDLKVETVDVGGSLRVDGKAKAEGIDVGGSFKAKGEVEADKMEVGGTVSIESKVNIKELDVGGTATVNGGVIHDIDVGGRFESHDSLEFQTIDVGGAVRLSSKNKGGEVDVGGSFKVEGDLEFEEIDVGGRVEITGSGEGKEMDVGGRVEVGGSLKLLGNLDVGGRAEVKGETTARNIEVGGALSAKKATVEDRVEVGGSITTLEGLSAHFAEIGNRGEIRGTVKADEIIIGKGARAEILIGKRILLRNGATVGSVYGETITVEPHCRINGDVQYTSELRMNGSVSLAKPPQKVEKLPF